MQRVCLAFARFCLSAWVGMAVFFVMVVISLAHSDLFLDEVKFNHPKILFPLYYSFEFALLGTALVCAGAGLWNTRIARLRRCSVLATVAAAAAVAVWDYAVVYRPLAAMLATNVLRGEFAALHQQSKWLNAAGLGISALAAILALWPENLDQAENPRYGPTPGANRK